MQNDEHSYTFVFPVYFISSDIQKTIGAQEYWHQAFES